METLICEAKLKPSTHENVLSRPRLMNQARAVENTSLVFLNAGPGYGKTILMEQLYRTSGGLRIWYRFDEADYEPGFFVSNLRDGIRRNFPALGGFSEEGIGECTNSCDAKAAMMLLVMKLSEKTCGPVSIFFDDFQKVDQCPPVRDAMRFLLKHLPDFCRIYISCRGQPNLGLGRLRLERRLSEIGRKELQFSDSEVRELFAGSCKRPLTKKEIEDWRCQTGGWPVALGYARSQVDDNKRTPQRVLPLIQSKSGPLKRFITENIWDVLDAESKSMLMDCSVVESVELGICGTVVGIPGATRKLESILKSGPISANVDCNDDHVINPLLRTYFNKKLNQSHTREQIRDLHLRYAQAFQIKGNLRNASDHFLMAERFDCAADLASPSRFIQKQPGCDLKEVRDSPHDRLAILTRREKQIYSLLAEGLSNSEIAARLHICETTAKKHVSNIFQKMGLTKRTQTLISSGEQ